MKISCKKLDPLAKLPTKANHSDAGWDLYACIPDRVILKPHDITKISTKISIELKYSPDEPTYGNEFDVTPYSYFLKFFDRSSMAAKGLIVVGGVIDEGYRNDIVIMLYNGTEKPYIVESGDKIAQFVILPVIPALIEEVNELGESERGGKGFGSSGK